MPQKRQRVAYQQLTQFERGRVIGLREDGFSYREIAETIGDVSIVYNCWQ